jgi:putative SOS response-associated peptidase YedK
MCFNSAQTAKKIYEDAKRMGASQEEIDDLKEMYEIIERESREMHLTRGYEHEKLITYRSVDSKIFIDRNHWGLIPSWVKNEETAKKIWNNTLNARGETIFEKPSFKDSAINNRSIIPLVGFYEHHHKNNKTFPYFIQPENGKNLFVAGLNSDWVNQRTGELIKTTSVVTAKGNELLTEIHNSPKLEEPRMPLILDDENIKIWLRGSKEEVQKLIRPNTSIKLRAHTVKQITGKNSMGNIKNSQEEYCYDEMNTLF